jgi:hypothetical protein
MQIAGASHPVGRAKPVANCLFPLEVSMRKSRYRFRGQPVLELLESRLTPSTFTVATLNDAEAGSLRQAILDANSNPGADVIDFSTAGIIQLTSGALPAITGPVTIDGTSAPGFAAAPVVEVDANSFAGLQFDAGSANSRLMALSVVNASGAGVRLGDAGIAVTGNYLGLTLDGTHAAGNAIGIEIDAAALNTSVGGLAAAQRNVISGNTGQGIFLNGATGSQIFGNFIGTDSSGHQPVANQIGIGISGSNNTVGGPNTGAGNVIAFNTNQGVLVSQGNGNAILGNSIHSNGGAGIELAAGANLNQVAPVLTFSTIKAGSIARPFNADVGGALMAAANTTYTIEIFATQSPTASGQGQIFLDDLSVTTNVNGLATFVLKHALVPAGSGITFTATATDAAHNSSRFSAAIGLSPPNQLFVANVYQLLLRRGPDPAFALWVNALDAGASAASVVLAIEGSFEYLNDQVFALYEKYLNRLADSAGAQFWTNFLGAGGSLEQLAEGLLSSDEYFASHGSTNQGFVQGLYLDVFIRRPSEEELNSWLAQLNSGQSRFSVTAAFLNSQEYRTALVQAYYGSYLLRPADDGMATWVSALNSGASDQLVLAAILGSPEGFSVWS